jgi:hypothetical protein
LEHYPIQPETMVLEREPSDAANDAAAPRLPANSANRIAKILRVTAPCAIFIALQSRNQESFGVAGDAPASGGRMFKRTLTAGALALFWAGAQGAASAEGPLDLHAVATSPLAVSRPNQAGNPAQRSIPSITVSPNVQAGSNGVNGAATGTYVAEAYRGGEYQGALTARIWGTGTTIGCLALSPIVAGALVDANEHRELTSREVHVLLADCTIPIIGGWLMNRYFDSIEAHRAADPAAAAAAPAAEAKR